MGTSAVIEFTIVCEILLEAHWYMGVDVWFAELFLEIHWYIGVDVWHFDDSFICCWMFADISLTPSISQNFHWMLIDISYKYPRVSLTFSFKLVTMVLISLFANVLLEPVAKWVCLGCFIRVCERTLSPWPFQTRANAVCSQNPVSKTRARG